MTDWGERNSAGEFLATAALVFNAMSSDHERLETALNGRMNSSKLLRDYFEPHKSRMNAALHKALGAAAAARYEV